MTVRVRPPTVGVNATVPGGATDAAQAVDALAARRAAARPGDDGSATVASAIVANAAMRGARAPRTSGSGVEAHLREGTAATLWSPVARGLD